MVKTGKQRKLKRKKQIKGLHCICDTGTLSGLLKRVYSTGSKNYNRKEKRYPKESALWEKLKLVVTKST